MTKRFEPSRDREVLIALDVQTARRRRLGGRLGRTTTSRRCTSSRRRSPGRSRVRRVAFGIAGRGLHRRRDAHRAACRSRPRRARPSGCWTCWPGCPAHASMPFERLLVGRGPDGPVRDDGPGAHGARPAPVRPPRCGGSSERRRRRPGRVRARGGSRRRARAGRRVRGAPGHAGRALAHGRAPGDRAMSGLVALDPRRARAGRGGVVDRRDRGAVRGVRAPPADGRRAGDAPGRGRRAGLRPVPRAAARRAVAGGRRRPDGRLRHRRLAVVGGGSHRSQRGRRPRRIRREPRRLAGGGRLRAGHGVRPRSRSTRAGWGPCWRSVSPASPSPRSSVA